MKILMRGAMIALFLVVALVTPVHAANAVPTGCSDRDIAQGNAEARSLNARIAAHNAKPRQFRIPEQQLQATAYQAEANRLNTERAALVAWANGCRIHLQGMGPGSGGPHRPSTPPPPQRPGTPAPSVTNPTPGYPAPERYKPNGKIISDRTDRSTLARTTRFGDGGVITLSRTQGRAATGMTAFVTPNMLKTGSASRGSVTPPGYRPGLERGHLLANRLGGLGRDARNIVAMTTRANDRMQHFENKVARAVSRGEAVHYSVTPIYGNGFHRPPTEIAVGAFGVRGGVIEFEVIPNVR
ncbi:DNA/RNA non-specific endonuclease [Gordonia sp. NPDC058843]|uniref:DNA/RNA non-specific endonuclease n=1 Tax=Gordonia sp. NPDC058843 TaxID=3346648 RepID=UPI0036BA05B9